MRTYTLDVLDEAGNPRDRIRVQADSHDYSPDSQRLTLFRDSETLGVYPVDGWWFDDETASA